MQYVSTGHAAKMLSVKPDTVVKWIKGGKLHAIKTAGGHYRIPTGSIASLLPADNDSSVSGGTAPARPLVPCWEYNAATGKIRENCRACLVFKARGGRCYEVGTILKGQGHGATCCSTDCEECAYYKGQRQRPVNVLIFSDNSSLKESLKKQAISSRLRLQFTSCEYDCSLIVDSFRPEYVVVDCAMNLDTCEELCRHLACDPRIPGVEIILAVPPGKSFETTLIGGITVIAQPFNVAEIENCIESFQQVSKA